MSCPVRSSKVTVAVLVGADRRRLRPHLLALEPCLSPGDDVVVAGPGHDPGSPRSWRVLEGTALGRPETLPQLNEVVVVLDARTVPAGPWIDPIAAALQDPTVGACAPRTNIAAGDELLVGVPYRPHETGVRRGYVSSIAKRRGCDLADADALAGPCVAVRKDLFLNAGGIQALEVEGVHGISSLAAAAVSRGLRTVVAEGSFLHHGGGAPPRPGPRPPLARPLVSACLIVKDERDNLGRCLSSLEGFCDEVVVYDTGSTDETKEIARAAGAVVVEGHWEDDFGAARNAALDHCTGEWVLWIDADEALVSDGPAQREALEAASADVEALVVMIDNLRGTAASTTFAHPACRLFRRAYGCWTGKLHEQVIARTGTPELELAVAKSLRITHWGYLAAEFEKKDKAARNLKSALADVSDDSGPPSPAKLVNLARSYALCGRGAEAVDAARSAIAAGAAPPVARRALRTIVAAEISLGRGAEALAAARELRASSQDPRSADVETARVLVSMGRGEEALEALSRVHEGVDEDGFEYGAHLLAALRAEVLSSSGRHGEAADVLLATIREHGGMDVHIGTLVRCLEAAGRPLTEIAEAVPEERAVPFLGQLPQLDGTVADRVLEAWHEAAPCMAVLATASTVAGSLPLDRAAVWSARLRAAGHAQACPLAKASGPPVQALAGAAIALDCHGDARGRMAVAAVAQCLSPEDRVEARRELERRTPSVVPYFDAVSALALADDPAAVRGASPPAPFPLGLREGICVAGDFGVASADELAHLEEAVLPRLSRRLGDVPVAVIGGGSIARALPGALDLGMRADPLPWVRAARAVLVGCRPGAERWLAAAKVCGTPALLVAGADVDEVVAAIGALADRRLDQLWAHVASPTATKTPAPLPHLHPERLAGAGA